MKFHYVTLPNGKRQHCRREYTWEEWVEEFWASCVIVQRSLATPCWEWSKCRNPGGYGGFNRFGRRKTTHRIAWELTHGKIPEGVSVCHHCDNPPCIRPDHLFLGTRSENAIDSVLKSRNHFTKLSPEDVREIRRLAQVHTPRATLTSLFGISPIQVSRIIHGTRWAFLP